MPARPSRRSPRKPDPAAPVADVRVAPLAILAILAALGAILAWAYGHLFAGEPHGLDNTAHLAEVTFLSRAMRAGDWNWWDPSGNSGFASGYYYQVLPQALTAALSALTGLAPLLAFQIAIFVPLLLAPVAAYRGMRLLGADPWAALGAAVALPFTTAGPLMAGPGMDGARWGHGADGALLGGLFTQLWAFAALPLALGHAARWLETGRGLAGALGWGLFVGLCHPFGGVALGVAVAAGAAWRALEGLRRRSVHAPDARALVVRLAGLGALLVAGSASAWLPVLVNYAGFGGFPERMADEVGTGFRQLAGWIASGRLLDRDRLPALTVLLPLVLFAARGRWLAWPWAAAGAYGVLLGVGPHLGKTEDDLFPAVRFLGPLQVMLGLAIGGGAAGLAQRLARSGRRGWRAAAAWALLIPLAIVVVGGALSQHRRVKVFSDFAFTDRADFVRAVEALPASTPGRLQVALGADCHWTIQLPYVWAGRPSVAVMGGAALQSSPNYAYAWAMRGAEPALVSWVFDAPLLIMRNNHAFKLAAGEVLWEGRTYQVRRFDAPGLVSPVRVVGELPAGRRAHREVARNWVYGPGPPEREVLARPALPAAPPAGRALDVSRGPSLIHARVRVDDDREGPTTFAVRESWHPRWRATLDGAPVAVRRITPDYMAVDVPRGDHALELRFRRPVWAWLLWIVPVLLVLGARAIEARRERVSASGEA